MTRSWAQVRRAGGERFQTCRRHVQNSTNVVIFVDKHNVVIHYISQKGDLYLCGKHLTLPQNMFGELMRLIQKQWRK